MAEEEKKPEFVLNKKEKKAESQPKQDNAQPKASDEKQPIKKRIIKRKSPSHPAAAVSDAQSASPANQNKISESGTKIQEKEAAPVKEPAPKNPPASSSPAANVSSALEKSSPSQAPSVAKTASQPSASAKPEQRTSGKESPASENKTFELKSARPNVRAGNLNPSNRNNGYNNRGSYNRNNNGGFTGAQARQGYQNRERQGGFNRDGGYNNRGNFNRDGQNSQQGGFNRGGYNNRD